MLHYIDPIGVEFHVYNIYANFIITGLYQNLQIYPKLANKMITSNFMLPIINHILMGNNPIIPPYTSRMRIAILGQGPKLTKVHQKKINRGR